MLSKNPCMSFDDARRLGEIFGELFFDALLRRHKRFVLHRQTRGSPNSGENGACPLRSSCGHNGSHDAR
jgi:hypothetical protein